MSIYPIIKICWLVPFNKGGLPWRKHHACISVGDAKLPSLDVLVAFEDRQPWTKGKSWFLVSNAHPGLPGGDSGEARWASGETASALQYKPLHQPINPAALCTLVQLSIHSIVVQQES